MPFLNLSKHIFCQQTADVLLKPCDEDVDVDGENNSARYVFFFCHVAECITSVLKSKCTKLVIRDNIV